VWLSPIIGPGWMRQGALIQAGVERPVGSDGCATVPAMALQRGDAMTWEWEHRSKGGQWVLTVGAWHAVVQRIAGSRPMWQAVIERTTAPHDRYTSPTYPEAVDARTWCLRTMAELTGAAS